MTSMQLNTITNTLILPAKESFTNDEDFKREAEFATQIFMDSDKAFLLKMALQNPQSAISAVKNVANLGLSLNPAKKEAYLVPRKGKVLLVPSYMGLLKCPMDEGIIKLAHCACVYEKDELVLDSDPSKPPFHKHNPFMKNKDRGEIVGVYCTLKLDENNWVTHVENREWIDKVRMCNESEKKGGTSAWTNWYVDMARKSVLKKALNMVKGGPKTRQLIEYLNTEAGEGIDFSKQEDSTPANDFLPPATDSKTDCVESKTVCYDDYLSEIKSCCTIEELTDLASELKDNGINESEGEEALKVIQVWKEKFKELKTKES